MMKLIDGAVLVRRITLDDLVIANNVFIKSAPKCFAPTYKATDVIFYLLFSLHSHYTCFLLTSSTTFLTRTAKSHFKHKLYYF